MTVFILFSCFPFFSAVNAEENDDFIRSLILCEDIDLPYKVNDTVYQIIKADTGQDDIYKTYIVTGRPISSYSGNKQSFENGRYEKGEWIPDYSAASAYIIRALDIYLSLERTLTNDRQSAARAVISYGFEALPLMSRINIENAPGWLAGAYHENITVLSYAENASAAGGAFSRKIRNDREECAHALCLEAENGDSYTLSVPQNALYFTAFLSTDLAFSASYSSAQVRVYITDGDNNERMSGIYCIYRGFENRLETDLKGVTKIRLEISFTSESERLRLILADASFMSPADTKAPVILNEGNITPLGDCDQNGIVNGLDIKALTDALLLKLSPGDEVCDVNKDGEVDYLDVLCLKNYIIYLKNMDHVYNKDNKKLSVAVFGDSIARGYGLEGAENGAPSPHAYGNLVADTLAKRTGYDVSFVNHGHDGDTVFDLMEKLQKSGLPERTDAEGADLILLSIGGNNFLQALRQVFEEYFGIDTGDPQKALHELSKVSYADMTLFLAGDIIDSAVDKAAKEFSKQAKELISYISELNPNALIMLTTIPNASVSSDFVYRMELPLVGEREIVLCNLYDLAQDWLCYFNEVIENDIAAYPAGNFRVVNVGKFFDGSPGLALMEISEKVYINDLASGDFSDIKHLDVHPSAKGHEMIAAAHVEALEDQIKKWNNENTETAAPKEEYEYSKSGKETLEAFAAEVTNGNNITFRASIENVKRLENLFFTVGFDREALRLISAETNGGEDVLFNESGGVFRLLSENTSSLPKDLILTLTFEKVSQDKAKTVIWASAKESILTPDKETSAVFSAEKELTLSAPSDTDGNSNGGFHNGGSDQNGSYNGSDLAEGDKTLQLSGSSSDGKVIIYAVFIAAVLAVLLSLAIAAKKKKESENHRS